MQSKLKRKAKFIHKDPRRFGYSIPMARLLRSVWTDRGDRICSQAKASQTKPNQHMAFAPRPDVGLVWSACARRRNEKKSRDCRMYRTRRPGKFPSHRTWERQEKNHSGGHSLSFHSHSHSCWTWQTYSNAQVCLIDIIAVDKGTRRRLTTVSSHHAASSLESSQSSGVVSVPTAD